MCGEGLGVYGELSGVARAPSPTGKYTHGLNRLAQFVQLGFCSSHCSCHLSDRGAVGWDTIALTLTLRCLQLTQPVLVLRCGFREVLMLAKR